MAIGHHARRIQPNELMVRLAEIELHHTELMGTLTLVKIGRRSAMCMWDHNARPAEVADRASLSSSTILNHLIQVSRGRTDSSSLSSGAV